MNDQVGIASLVEEPLEDESTLRRQMAERRLALSEILDELSRSRVTDTESNIEFCSNVGRRCRFECYVDVLAQRRYGCG